MEKIYRSERSMQALLSFFTIAAFAILIPTNLAFNLSPSATFLNQATSLLGWGWGLVLVCWVKSFTAQDKDIVGRVAFGFILLGIAVFFSALVFQLPSSLAISSLGFLIAAFLTVQITSRLNFSSKYTTDFFPVFTLALGTAGAISLFFAFVQYFAPQWTDGNWIAHIASPGRAGGNLRQPNHLSSLLLFSIASLIWLHEIHVEKRICAAVIPLRVASAILISALLFGVVLTVSRTGTMCVVLLALWGVVDRQMSRFTRTLLWFAPLIYSLCWFGMSEWSQMGAHDFAGGSQLHKADPSSSRFGIWGNTLSLIAMHPWFGVGWGEFNFAWTLTPFPGRPPAFFDHTHNLPLQFLVELGIPLGGVILALLAYGLWKAFRACLIITGPSGPMVRTSFVMVLMMMVHSMLEYPLWYAYFLLPTAFAFGICLGHSEPSPTKAELTTAPASPWVRRALMAASATLMIGTIASVFDYMRVAAIFAPPANAAPLSVRIEDGQRSWFFAHHADYAAATTAEHPSEVMGAFKRATHYLLDTRLMMAWARAFDESGDVERARYLADRMREFNNAQSKEFFAECDEPRAADEALPFQCTPATQHFTYEDFR